MPAAVGLQEARRISQHMERPDLGLVLAFGLAIGLVDGLLTVFVGLAPALEFSFWTLSSIATVAYVVMRGQPAPFLSLLLVFVVAGVAVGSMQWAFAEQYVANYPGDVPDVAPWQFLAFGVVIGAVWGALFGGIAAFAAKRRAGRDATPA